MAKIARKDAERLAARVVQKAHGQRFMAALSSYFNLSKGIYRAALPPDLLSAMIEYPAAFHQTTSESFYLNGQTRTMLFKVDYYSRGTYLPNGWSIPQMDLGEQIPESLSTKLLTLTEADKAVVADAQDYVLEIVAEVEALQERLTGTILGFGTWKRLAEGWPEIAEEIPAHHLAKPEPQAHLPVDTSKLTSELGLPFPKETSDAVLNT